MINPSAPAYPPSDARLHTSRHTNTHFPITHFSTREEVDTRREALRFNLRMAAGLYPWPQKTPLHTRYEDVGTFDGFSVKKIMFETVPGFWSTGNLYLPHPMKPKMPAIFNVIGHWEEQRLTRDDTADYPNQLANFARMGFVCLVTDMIGMVDSRQITHNYGGTDKELWLSGGVGIQLWNNIRALDLLCSLPYVDAENIGMTGASGGGSQTLFLSLLDDRIKAAAPINMISLSMQGGCSCENAPGLRRETDNTEMCAMLAPRPLFLAGSTGDWTRWLESDELPGVLEAYQQYAAEDMVEHFYQDAEHQYNDKTRHQVYSFFARHLMGCDPAWEEQDLAVRDLPRLTWFNNMGHADGISSDEEFLAKDSAARAQRIASLPDNEKRRMLAWSVGYRDASHEWFPLSTEHGDGYTCHNGLLLGNRGEKLPVTTVIPETWDGKSVCVILSEQGRDILSSEKGTQMLASGHILVSCDLFLTGVAKDSVPIDRQTPDTQQYYSTFHSTDDAYRVCDAAEILAYANTFGASVSVIADGCAARAAALALALGGNAVSAQLEKSAVCIPQEAYSDSFFIPGILAFGGIDACLQLICCPITFF